MEIRKLTQLEIKPALELIWVVFEQFEAPDYSEQGVASFKEFISYDNIATQFDSGAICFWGYFKDDILVGVIATRGINHICILFVKQEFHRQGIARFLFQEVKTICMGQKDVTEITVNSSPYAIEAYRRLGFEETTMEQTIDGIRFTPMKHAL